MHQARLDLNADSTTSRKNRRPALAIAVGAIALAIAAAVVVEEQGGRASAGNEAARASVLPLAATTMESTTSATDSAKPHFERSDEPAYEDTVHPVGD